ncbi:MAG TPA: hypothetical protein VEI02_15790, partial [Planctomycetota bacterium]|nr:hypothetical protein [Planctomycetota bacterium]
MHAGRSDEVRAETLLRDADRLRGAPCTGCGTALCGHDVIAAVLLGFRDAPRCARCVALGLGSDPEAFAAEVRSAAFRRDCYREAWETTTEREGACPRAGDPARDVA